MVLVGELLSFAFVVIDKGLQYFDWLYFGAVSFLVQWIILSSAALLCPLRQWFKRQNGWVAGTVSYLIVLFMTLIFTLLGIWSGVKNLHQSGFVLANNIIIAGIFAGVVLRYFYLQQQLINREQAELRSRIQALQSRIRPHFLFNSMNSIASLIDADPVVAEKMVIDLSQLFRSSLSEPSLVPLKDELSLCTQFISIEKIRLGERLHVDWEIALGGSPHDEQLTIPSLTLQPLIENAIYHGIQPLADGGEVKVKVRADDDCVMIVVENPCPVNNANNIKKSGNGIALDLIRNRLYAHYGDKVVFRVEELNNHFCVQMQYPIVSENG
ncbi:MAG: two-component system sensor histidine kinase AlgZ [Lentisphaeria bacterium]